MSLKGRHVLVTAGPTHEPIDPVRFIGNHSSGKMGYAICQELQSKGAKVTLVSGPTALKTPDNVERIDVKSAAQMYENVKSRAVNADVLIFAAAVADYTPKTVADRKIKKKEESFSIELVKTVDIAKTLGENKRDDQVHVGFALETNDEVSNASKKLISKNLDFIVLNSLKNMGTCFGSDNNKITIIESNKSIDFELKSKEEVAKDIVAHLEKRLDEKSN